MKQPNNKVLSQAREVLGWAVLNPYAGTHLETTHREQRDRRAAAVHFWLLGLSMNAIAGFLQCTHQNVSAMLIGRRAHYARQGVRTTYARDRMEAKEMMGAYPDTYAELMERGSESGTVEGFAA